MWIYSFQEDRNEGPKPKGENDARTTMPAPSSTGDDKSLAKSSCLSHSSYPQSDRYSVAGMSSASGSEVKSDSQLKYRHGAKELASAVHHALRTELKECHCQPCLEKQKTSRKLDGQPHQRHQEIPQSAHCPCCKHLQNDTEPYPHQRSSSSSVKLTSTNLEALKTAQAAIDHQRIYSWIEHNEKYRSEMGQPHVVESPRDTPMTKRRHRPPVVYDTTRPDYHYMREPGIALEPLPDTSLVLEEAKRRLEDNTRGISRSSRKSGRSSSRWVCPHFPYT